MGPINYGIDVQTPFQAALEGYKGGAAIRNDQFAQQQQQLALQQQQQQGQVIHALISNPNASAADYANATLAVPGMREQLKQAWDTKNADQQQSHIADLSQWGAAIQQGQPQVASDAMRARADAMDSSTGGPSQKSQYLRAQADVIDAHPDFAGVQMKMMLAAQGDQGQKVLDQMRLLKRDPDVDRKTTADATAAEADAAVKAGTVPDKVAAAGLANADVQSQITDRSKRFALDTDKFRSETGLKVQELSAKLGELPEFVAKDVTSAATDSIAAGQSAARMTDLAARIDAEQPVSGITAKGAELLKRVTGNQNEVSRLRAEYNRIVTPAAMAAYKTVASGSTSDKDIETAMTGVPTDTADPATMASFLRGAAKLQVYDSVINNAKSEWLQNVHSLGKSPRDTQVDGVTVPAGMTFKAFTDAYVANKVAAQSNALDLSTRGYMKYAQPDTAPVVPAVPAASFGGT